MTSRPSVLVLFDHGRGPAADADWDADPDSFPYGYGHASPYLALSASISSGESTAVRFLRRGAAFLTGFDLVHAFRNRALIRTADAVITHTEHEHLAVALLIRLGVVPEVPVIGQSVWLWDEWHRYGPLRRRILRWLLKAIAVHTVLSPLNADEGTRRLGEPVRLLPYGASDPGAASADRAPRAELRSVEVVAPGSDRHRDWRTLVEAAEADPSLRVTIVSRRRGAVRAARRCPGRVRVVAARSSSEVRRLLDAGDVVAVPLEPNLHASGLTVLFEGLHARRPIAMTRTGGAPYYGADHVDWAVVGDARSLADAIHRARARRDRAEDLELAWESVIDRGLTMKDYGLRHVIAVWLALRLPTDPALLSRASPLEEIVRAEADRLAAPVPGPAAGN